MAKADQESGLCATSSLREDEMRAFLESLGGGSAGHIDRQCTVRLSLEKFTGKAIKGTGNVKWTKKSNLVEVTT